MAARVQTRDPSMVQALILALTGPTDEPEWVSFKDIITRMLNAGFSVTREALAGWLDFLISVRKVQGRARNGQAEYHIGPPDLVYTPRPKKKITPIEREASGGDQMPRALPIWYLKKREAYENKIARQGRRIQEMEMAILAHNTETKRALSIYGSPNALEELTKVVSLSPKFADLTPAEHRYVAGVGLMSGINPEFHLHAWKQKKKVERNGQEEWVEVLIITPDYKGLIAATPDPIMVKEVRLTADEMRERGVSDQAIKSGAIGYKVIGTNLKHAIMARQAEIEYEPFMGYGVWYGSADKSKSTPSNGRDGAWEARRRGFRDLFNQVTDLTLKFGQVPGATMQADAWQFDGDVVMGEFTEEREPDGWQARHPDAIPKAEAYRDSLTITDDAINADLGCDDWRLTPLTADELKIAMDQVKVKKDMAGADTGEPVEEKLASTPVEAGEASPPESCANCANAPDPAAPYPTLCKACNEAKLAQEQA